MPPFLTETVAVAGDGIAPTVRGGAVVTWSVSPPLPPGLQLNGSSGVITGTPGVLLPGGARFVVTAANTGGAANTTITLVVLAGVTDVLCVRD